MSEFTPFAGLTQLEPFDPLSTDNFAFQSENPRVTDLLLKIGAVTHKHDAHPALANPVLTPSGAALASGGTIPADLTISFGYTLLDIYGGETALNDDPLVVTTQDGLLAPDDGPTAVVSYAGGTLLQGNYAYSITVTDGLGGETALGPTTTVTIDPGYASGQVTVSGLTALVSAAGGTGWRLWRRINGGLWALVQTGSVDSVIDDGALCSETGVVPPADTTGYTNGTNRVMVMVPSGQASAAQGFRLYASLDGSFFSPSLINEYPMASAGVNIILTELDLLDGAPPPVSRSYPGASKIDPDTDLLDWHWKRPVATSGDLGDPGDEAGDVRITLDTLDIYAYDGASWMSFPTGHEITSSGGVLPQQPTLHIFGSGVKVYDDSILNRTIVEIPVGGHRIEDESVPVVQSETLDFRGAGVTVVASGARTVVTIPGGGGGGGSGHVILDEGSPLPAQPDLDFVGAGVTVTDGPGSKTTVTITGGSGVASGYAGTGGHIIQDEGVDLTQRSKLDFAGAGVTVIDSGGRTLVTIPGGSGGGGSGSVAFGSGYSARFSHEYGPISHSGFEPIGWNTSEGDPDEYLRPIENSLGVGYASGGAMIIPLAGWYEIKTVWQATNDDNGTYPDWITYATLTADLGDGHGEHTLATSGKPYNLSYPALLQEDNGYPTLLSGPVFLPAGTVIRAYGEMQDATFTDIAWTSQYAPFWGTDADHMPGLTIHKIG